MPSPSAAEAFKNYGGVIRWSSLPWHAQLLYQWEAGVCDEWNAIIGHIDAEHGPAVMEQCVATRMRWGSMRLAHTMPPQDPPLFEVRTVCNAMFVMPVDLASGATVVSQSYLYQQSWHI